MAGEAGRMFRASGQGAGHMEAIAEPRHRLAGQGRGLADAAEDQ